MHELNIAARIATRTREEKGHRRWGHVNQVHLEVGSLSGVDPDALSFAFEALVAETDLSGCRLEIVPVSPVCVCRDCSARFEVRDLTYQCPTCGARDVTMVRGDELHITSMTGG